MFFKGGINYQDVLNFITKYYQELKKIFDFVGFKATFTPN